MLRMLYILPAISEFIWNQWHSQKFFGASQGVGSDGAPAWGPGATAPPPDAGENFLKLKKLS